MNKPVAFSGRPGDVASGAYLVDFQVANGSSGEALLIAASYLQNNSFAWWQTFAKKKQFLERPTLREELKLPFDP